MIYIWPINYSGNGHLYIVSQPVEFVSAFRYIENSSTAERVHRAWMQRKKYWLVCNVQREALIYWCDIMTSCISHRIQICSTLIIMVCCHDTDSTNQFDGKCVIWRNTSYAWEHSKNFIICRQYPCTKWPIHISLKLQQRRDFRRLWCECICVYFQNATNIRIGLYIVMPSCIMKNIGWKSSTQILPALQGQMHCDWEVLSLACV